VDAEARAKVEGVALGGGLFLLLSFVAHCGFGLGPWPCQRRERGELERGELERGELERAGCGCVPLRR
jgi:hypothetical protein